MQRSASFWVAILIVAGFLLIWQIATSILQTPVYLLPSPASILSNLFANPSLYLQASLITFGQALAGLMIGMLVSFLLASLLLYDPRLEGGVLTLAILAKSTPLVAVAPLLTLWLGFGYLPKVVITALLTFFPALVNLTLGLNRIDPSLLDLYRSWGLSRGLIYRYLRLPSALPYFFAALKICAPLSVIGAVVAEWTGASGGLGRVMWLAYTNLNLPYLFGAIFILALGGMVQYWLIDHFEKRTLFWLQPEVL